MEEQTYHVPVLLQESIDGMNLQPRGVYVESLSEVVDIRKKFSAKETVPFVCSVLTRTKMQNETS